MKKNKLGFKWWLSLLLGIVLGLATGYGGIVAYSIIDWEMNKKDWFYSDYAAMN